MAAQFRMQITLDGFQRFQELAAMWATLNASEQSAVINQAKLSSAQNFLYPNEFGRLAKWEGAREQAGRLRELSKLWPKMSKEAQAYTVGRVHSLARVAGESISLASIADKIDRLDVGIYNTARRNTLTGDAARRWAIANGQRMGCFRPGYGCWCADHVPGLGMVTAHGPAIAQLAGEGATSDEEDDAELVRA